MSSDWIVTCAPVAGLVADAVAQVIFAHLSHRTNRSISFGAICGIAVTAAVLWRVVPATMQAVPIWLLGLATYAALAFGYWAFLNLNLTSLRIRMIRELLHSEGGISRAELMQRYSPEEFLRRRLERLEQSSKQLRRDAGGRWKLRSRSLLTVAQIMGIAKSIIIPRPRGE